MDPVDILERADLACRITGKGERHVLAGDPLSVVGDANRFAAALLQVHGDLGGSRIQRIFQQLLDDGSRSINHLARGNPVGQRFRQNDNSSRQFSPPRR